MVDSIQIGLVCNVYAYKGANQAAQAVYCLGQNVCLSASKIQIIIVAFKIFEPRLIHTAKGTFIVPIGALGES